MKGVLAVFFLSAVASAAGIRTTQRDLSCVNTIPGETREAVWHYVGHVAFDLSGNDALRLEIRPRFLSDLRIGPEAQAPAQWRLERGRLIGTSVKRVGGVVWSVSVVISPRAVSFAHQSSEALGLVGRSTRTCALRDPVSPQELYHTIQTRLRARRTGTESERAGGTFAAPTSQELLDEIQGRRGARQGAGGSRRPR